MPGPRRDLVSLRHSSRDRRSSRSRRPAATMPTSEKPYGIFCTDHLAFMPGIGQIGVEIKQIDCFYESGESRKFWLIQVNTWTERDILSSGLRNGAYLYEDDAVPLFIRQTLATGYEILTHGVCESCDYYTTNSYVMPENAGNADFRNLYFQSRDYEEDFAIVRRLHDQSGSMLSERAICARIIKELHTPWNAHRLRVFRVAFHWCNSIRAKRAEKTARRRVQARTDILLKDLMEATWHPSRFTDWCLDSDDRAEIAEFFAKK